MAGSKELQEKRRRQIEMFCQNGMFVPRDFLGDIKHVVGRNRELKLEILGSTLRNGVMTRYPESNVGIRLNLLTVKDFDLFWGRVRDVRVENGKIKRERE